MGFSCRKIFEVANQIDYRERCAYRLQILERCFYPEMLVTIDETSKGKGDGCRDRMWLGRGLEPNILRFFGNDVRYSMIAAADCNGFIIPACSVVLRENGDTDSDSSHGTIGKERFILWVKQCLVPVLGNYELRQPYSLVLLDNATIHHSDEAINLIRMAGAEVVYLSP